MPLSREKSKNIEILKSLMENCSVTDELYPVVLFGSLLGIVRNNDLLSWNNDIELGIHEDNWDEQKIHELCLQLRKQGYIVNYYKLTKAVSIRSVCGKGEVHINFFKKFQEIIIRPIEPSDLRFTNIFSYYLYFLAILCSSDLDSNNNSSIKKIFYYLNKILNYNIRKYFSYFILKITIFITSCKGTYLFPFSIKKIIKYKFYDFFIYIPFDAKYVVKKTYGDEWNIPKKSWSYYDQKEYS